MFRSFSGGLSALVVVSFVSVAPRLPGAESKREHESKPEPAWEQVIRRGLDKAVTLEAVEVPLGDVVEQLARQAGIPNVLLDERALEGIGIGPHTPVTRNLKGISLRNVLRLILKDFDLTFVIHDEVLLITTPEEAQCRNALEVFDVLDLVRFHDETPPEEYEYDTVIELITSTVEPTTWVDAGGVGSIAGFRGTLIVSQSQDVLEMIPPLFDSVRQAHQIVAKHGKRAPPVTSLLVGPPRVQVIDRALAKRVTCDFRETSLQDVVDFLSRTSEIPIQFDNRAIEDVGIGRHVPVTFSATDMTLAAALRHLLDPLDLAYMQYCSVLYITTPEEAEVTLETRVYPVGDLLSGVSAGTAGGWPNYEGADYDTLIELTESTVAPTTWAEVGGAGTIEEMPTFGLCVVSQTAEVHQDVERLLAELRKTIPRQNLTKAQVDENGLRLVVYFVSSKSATGAATSGPGCTGSGLFEGRELLELIQDLVEPESWQGEGVYARAAAGRLIIRQTDDVHRQTRRMLQRLDVFFYEMTNMPRPFSGNIGLPGMGSGFPGP